MADKKIKILIVDDEPEICKFVKLLFRKKGFLVYSALSGSEAIRITKKVKPNVALLDIYLKRGMDGLQALKQIAKISPDCICAMVTWDKTALRMKEAKKGGAVCYITKPLTTNNLYRVVSSLVKNIRKRG